MTKLKESYKSLHSCICLPIREDSTLYPHTSKFTTDNALYALYQVKNGQPRLIAYAGRRIPTVAQNYSITKLELYGLTMNIASFSHLLKKVNFDAVVRTFSSNTYQRRVSQEPATTRIREVIRVLSSYTFNLYYLKVIDMVLSNFLQGWKDIRVALMQLSPYH